MSKVIEGKVTIQSAWVKLNGSVTCAKCGKVFSPPETFHKELKSGPCYGFSSYLQTERFIFETNAGYAIVYCSEYCARKHNHRFQK